MLLQITNTVIGEMGELLGKVHLSLYLRGVRAKYWWSPLKRDAKRDLLEQEGKPQLPQYIFLRKGDLLEMLLYENAEIDNARHEK
jgi:hypothetical protein